MTSVVGHLQMNRHTSVVMGALMHALQTVRSEVIASPCVYRDDLVRMTDQVHVCGLDFVQEGGKFHVGVNPPSTEAGRSRRLHMGLEIEINKRRNEGKKAHHTADWLRPQYVVRWKFLAMIVASTTLC